MDAFPCSRAELDRNALGDVTEDNRRRSFRAANKERTQG
jgi:hypothetical protein